jgi:hypothetical protein
MDEQLNTSFDAVHDVLFDAEATALLTEQRRWLKQRDETCGKGTADQLKGCLSTLVDARNRELKGKALGVHVDEQRGLGPNEAIMVLDKRLTVVELNESKKVALIYNDVVLADAYNKIAIEGRFRNKAVEAVLISLDRGGTLDCAVYAVIEVRRNEPLRVRKFHGDKLGCEEKLVKSPRGFELQTSPTPDADGVAYVWYANGYNGSGHSIPYVTEKGSKLESVREV